MTSLPGQGTIAGLKCVQCGEHYPSKYYFKDEGRSALVCTRCAGRIGRGAAPKPAAPVTDQPQSVSGGAAEHSEEPATQALTGPPTEVAAIRSVEAPLEVKHMEQTPFSDYAFTGWLKIGGGFALGGTVLFGIPRMTKLTESGIRLDDALAPVLGPIVFGAFLLAIPIALFVTVLIRRARRGSMDRLQCPACQTWCEVGTELLRARGPAASGFFEVPCPGCNRTLLLAPSLVFPAPSSVGATKAP